MQPLFKSVFINATDSFCFDCLEKKINLSNILSPIKSIQQSDPSGLKNLLREDNEHPRI